MVVRVAKRKLVRQVGDPLAGPAQIMTENEGPTNENNIDPAAIAASIDGDETITLLQALVRTRSPYFEEAAIAAQIQSWLDDHGLASSYHQVADPDITGFEGDNVIARLEGTDDDAPTIMLNAHMDTVRIADGWEEDPLSGRIEDGKLYGQGAADMKGGLAALLVAFRALAAAESDHRGSVLLTVVVDEEGPYGLGTDQLIRDGIAAECDMAIVPEPGPTLAQSDISNPALLLGARGRFLYDITVRGRSGHAATPDGSRNAVVDAGRLAAAMTELSVEHHPKLGRGSVCPLLIKGGSETLSVPDRCRLLVDRHVVFGETMETLEADVRGLVDNLDLESSVEVGFQDVPHPDARYGPYVTDENHELVRVLTRATKSVTGQTPAIGYFASVGDFNYLGHRACLPTVIVGPDGGNLHAPGEFVYTDEVVQTARIVAAATADLVG